MLLIQLRQVAQLGDVFPDDILHPFGVCGRECCVPVIQDCKFDRDDVSSPSFDTIASRLDLTAEVERPG